MITETTEPTGKRNGGPPMFCFVNIESDVAKAYPLLSPVRKRLLLPFLMTKIPSFSLSLSPLKSYNFLVYPTLCVHLPGNYFMFCVLAGS